MRINENQWQSQISHEVSWWDIFVVQVSLLCQWYLTKLVRYFCDKSDTSNTANSSDASKTSASVTWLSSYFTGS